MNVKELREIKDIHREVKQLRKNMCYSLDQIAESLIAIGRIAPPDLIYLLSHETKESKNAKR